jgi:hypothetical protein
MVSINEWMFTGKAVKFWSGEAAASDPTDACFLDQREHGANGKPTVRTQDNPRITGDDGTGSIDLSVRDAHAVALKIKNRGTISSKADRFSGGKSEIAIEGEIAADGAAAMKRASEHSFQGACGAAVDIKCGAYICT